MAVTAALSLSVDPISGAAGDKGTWRKHQVYSGASALTAVGGDFTGDGLPDVITNSEGRTRLLVAPEWKEDPVGAGGGKGLHPQRGHGRGWRRRPGLDRRPLSAGSDHLVGTNRRILNPRPGRNGSWTIR